jgi:type IV secretion system protein VirB9
MKYLFLLIFSLSILLSFALSCATVDVEKQIKNEKKSGGVQKEQTETKKTGSEGENAAAFLIESTVLDIEPEVVLIEKPVYIPEKQYPAVPLKPGRDSVEASTSSGTEKPKDYSRAARIYDYHPDQVYEVYTQTLRMTDIYLEEGEAATEMPFLSDNERWILGGGVSYQGERKTQHIYVKPTEANIEASLIINTDRRVYHILLRSYTNVYMPIVRWRYKLNNLPGVFMKAEERGAASSAAVSVSQTIGYIDPRYLSFDYRISYSAFGKPDWLPRLVYDDGKKTYIVFPEQTLQKELPAVFENRDDIVNYRVSGNLIVIDKLIKKLSVKLKKEKINGEKK